MSVPDISGYIETWEEEIDEIIALVDEWSHATIYIDVTKKNAALSAKWQAFKKKWDSFIAGINKRLAGLRKKIISTLHSIYISAKEKLDAFKNVIDPLLALADLSISLDSIVKCVTAIVNALVGFAKFMYACYLELFETVEEITLCVAKLAILVEKVTTAKLPRVVFADGEEAELEGPKMESITLTDITEGITDDITIA